MIRDVITEIFDMQIIPNKRIAEWDETKWIVLSSCFFTIPSIYGYYKGLYFLANVLFLTSIISANYWRNATYTIRRVVDRSFAKFSFVTFVYNGAIHVRYVPYFIFGWSGLIILLYCYYQSNKYGLVKDKKWIKYHMVFHAIMACNQIIILNSIR
jgi:hypothetical protein